MASHVSKSLGCDDVELIVLCDVRDLNFRLRTPNLTLRRQVQQHSFGTSLDYEAYLTDFGVAKLVETAASHTLSKIAVSPGYVAPGDLLSSVLIVALNDLLNDPSWSQLGLHHPTLPSYCPPRRCIHNIIMADEFSEFGAYIGFQITHKHNLNGAHFKTNGRLSLHEERHVIYYNMGLH